MEEAIDLLMQEHRVIESVLAALDSFSAAVERGDGFEPSDLQKFVTFFREYADKKHHGKEEDVLFPAMHDHGFPRKAGPVAAMLREHDLGRGLVGKLRAVAEADSWPKGAGSTIRQASVGFIRMLRAHIEKEDAILYPMAIQAVPPEAFAQIDEQCEALEQAYVESGDKARLESIAKELGERYG